MTPEDAEIERERQKITDYLSNQIQTRNLTPFAELLIETQNRHYDLQTRILERISASVESTDRTLASMNTKLNDHDAKMSSEHVNITSKIGELSKEKNKMINYLMGVIIMILVALLSKLYGVSLQI